MEDDALADSGPTPPVSPGYTSSASIDLMDEYLPKVIPSCITLTITKRSILELAIVKLGVKLHEIRVTDMDDNDLLGSVCMDVPPHREYPYTSRQVFFGLCTPWNGEAIESACSTALDYLKRVGVLIIHDADYADLKTCQAKLQEALFWEDGFRNSVTTLQASLPRTIPASNSINISDESDTDNQFDTISTKMTPASINKLPTLRNNDLSSTSTARKALFQEPGHQVKTRCDVSLKVMTNDLVNKNKT